MDGQTLEKAVQRSVTIPGDIQKMCRWGTYGRGLVVDSAALDQQLHSMILEGFSDLNNSVTHECVPKLIRKQYPVPPMAPGQRECCGQEPSPAQTFPFSLLGHIQVLSLPWAVYVPSLCAPQLLISNLFVSGPVLA